MNIKHTPLLITLIASLAFLTSCEDKINLKLDEGKSQLVVDAFLTDQRIPQKIHLTKTSPYFDNSPSPAAAGATVTVTDELTKKVFVFNDTNNDGYYSWVPTPGDTLAIVNHNYSLSVIYGNNQFSAVSTLNPVPKIDSLTYTYKEAGGMVQEAGYYAEFFGIDIKGRHDFYWIKSFRNNTFNNNPNAINLAADAAFGGDGADGFMFILPIRQSITPRDKPFKKGEQVKVELHAITQQAYDFLTEISTQSQNGGLFAVPTTNITSTIKNSNTQVTALGCFNIAAVSEKQIEIK